MFAPFLYQLILNFVTVLKFIDEQIGECGIQCERVEQKVVEITHAVFPQPRAIAFIGFWMRAFGTNAAFYLRNLLQKALCRELEPQFL